LHVLTFLGSSTTVQSSICQVALSPTITQPTNLSHVTVDTSFLVSGAATQGNQITLIDNDVDVATVIADENDHYSVYLSTSTSGTHTIAVQAQNACGTTTGDSISITAESSPPSTSKVDSSGGSLSSTSLSQPPTIPTTTRDQTAPPSPENTSSAASATTKGLRLSISSLANGSTTAAASLFLTGSVSSSALITITDNGAPVASSDVPQKSFGYNVPLSSGVNNLIIQAAGNNSITSVQLTITRVTTATHTPWYKTSTAQTIVGAAAVTSVSLLFILFLVGIVLL